MSWNMSSVIANGGNLASVSSLSYRESQADEPKQGSLIDTGRSGAIGGHTRGKGVITSGGKTALLWHHERLRY